MRRREFITLVGGVAATWPLAAHAQRPDKIRLIGVLMGFAENDSTAQSMVAAFRAALAKDHVGPQIDKLFLLGQTTPVTAALAHETQDISIVFVTVSDPIGSGLTASLAHPGGNITGFSVDDIALGSKWMELLKEIAPRTARVAEARCLLMAHRVIWLRCRIWSLLVRSGLWQAVRPADSSCPPGRFMGSRPSRFSLRKQRAAGRQTRRQSLVRQATEEP